MLLTAILIIVFSIIRKQSFLKTLPTLVTLIVQLLLARANRFAFLLGGTIYGMSVGEAFAAFWAAVLIFNLIKTVLVGVITMLLYKRLSNFLKKMKI